MTDLYFAYGSNMSLAQMAERCPASPRVGIGRLDGYRLVFPRFSTKRNCGAASVEPCGAAHVWGVLYRMDPADLSALDRHEGCDPRRAPHLNNYNRRQVQVLKNGTSAVECLTYIATPQPGLFSPSAHYHSLIHSGALENGIPADYVETLLRIPVLST